MQRTLGMEEQWSRNNLGLWNFYGSIFQLCKALLPSGLFYFFLLLIFRSFYLFFSSYMQTFSLYLIHSWQVKERLFKIDQIVTTDFSWMIGLKYVVFLIIYAFIFYYGYIDIMILLSEKKFLSGTLFEMSLVLEINYKSTLGFIEYITPKNQYSFP